MPHQALIRPCLEKMAVQHNLIEHDEAEFWHPNNPQRKVGVMEAMLP